MGPDGHDAEDAEALYNYTFGSVASAPASTAPASEPVRTPVAEWSSHRVRSWMVLVAGVSMEEAQKVPALNGMHLQSWTKDQLQAELTGKGLSPSAVASIVAAAAAQKWWACDEDVKTWTQEQVQVFCLDLLQMDAADAGMLSTWSGQDLVNAADTWNDASTALLAWGLSDDGVDVLGFVLANRRWSWYADFHDE